MIEFEHQGATYIADSVPESLAVTPIYKLEDGRASKTPITWPACLKFIEVKKGEGRVITDAPTIKRYRDLIAAA